MLENLLTDEEKTEGNKNVVLQIILRIPWIECINNEEDLRKYKQKETLGITFLGHN